MTNYALRWLYVLQLSMGLWTPFLAISQARDGTDVVCGHLMMRSFSLNENFALLAVERVRVRDPEEGESQGGVQTLLPQPGRRWRHFDLLAGRALNF